MVQLVIARSVHCNKRPKIWYTTLFTRSLDTYLHSQQPKRDRKNNTIKYATKYKYIENTHTTEVHTY